MGDLTYESLAQSSIFFGDNDSISNQNFKEDSSSSDTYGKKIFKGVFCFSLMFSSSQKVATPNLSFFLLQITSIVTKNLKNYC